MSVKAINIAADTDTNSTMKKIQNIIYSIRITMCYYKRKSKITKK